MKCSRVLKFYNRTVAKVKISQINDNDKVGGTLRTPIYTAMFLVQAVWLIYVLIYMCSHLHNYLTTSAHTNFNETFGEFSHLLELVILLVIPVSFILPPLVIDSRIRIIVQLISNCLVILASSVFVLSLLIYLLSQNSDSVLSDLPYAIPELWAASAISFCCYYLNVKVRYSSIHHPSDKAEIKYSDGIDISDESDPKTDIYKNEEYWRIQGNIHGAELLILSGCGVLAACGDGVSHIHEDKMISTLQLFYPWFFLSFLLIVQIRHSTFVHNDYHSVYRARARTKQFLSQYHLSPLEREIANEKDLPKICLDHICLSAIYPECSCC